jgi:hypothetical protein
MDMATLPSMVRHLAAFGNNPQQSVTGVGRYAGGRRLEL